MSPIVIAGATRGVGLALARHERERGRMVVALVRPGSNATELRRIGADLVWGDALIRSDLPRLFEGLPAACNVVSTLPGHWAEEGQANDAGNINLVDAAVSGGLVGRFLLVTAIEYGETAHCRSECPVMAFTGAVDANTGAEEYLRRSNLSWTILRAGRLRGTTAAGFGMPTTAPGAHGGITRDDVAWLAFRILRDPSTAHKAFAAVDIETASGVTASTTLAERLSARQAPKWRSTH